jgi:hypothetical protein
MSTRYRRSIRPSLESLEVRDTPAGTVNVAFAAGRLTLIGDAADNIVRIGQGVEDRLTITGNGSDTQFRLNGGPAQGFVDLPAPITGAVNIALGNGADEFVINGVELPGSLIINGGNGAAEGTAGNTVYLQDLHVGGNLVITNLAGSDSTYLWGAVSVRGGMTIRNGHGGSRVWADPTTDLRVRGLLRIANGNGFDEVELGGSTNVALGGLAVSSGADLDGSYLRVHPNGDLTVTGGVRVINGRGSDFTDFGGRNATIGGGVAIYNGDGGSFNNILTQGAFSAAYVVVTNGDGEDYNQIVTFDSIAIRYGVSFNNAAGVATNYVGGGNLLTVGGGISFLNGTGRDLNTVFSRDTQVRGAITVRNGEGDSDTSIGGTNKVAIVGAIRVTSTAGLDNVTIGAGRLQGTTPAVDVGPMLVNLGNGGSDTQIRGGRLAVHGPVYVKAVEGTDTVLVATESESGLITGNAAIDVGPGDQQMVKFSAPVERILRLDKSLGISMESSIGPSYVYLSRVDARSWTKIVTGDGADEVRVTGSTFAGEFGLDTAAGGDSVYIEWTGGATTFRRAVKVNTGDGNDLVWLAWNGAAIGQAIFTAATHWDGGAGTGDLIALQNTGSVFLGPEPEVSGFETAI